MALPHNLACKTAAYASIMAYPTSFEATQQELSDYLQGKGYSLGEVQQWIATFAGLPMHAAVAFTVSGQGNEATFVAFSGTEPKVIDWLIDFNLTLIPFPPMFWTNTNAHGGFLAATLNSLHTRNKDSSKTLLQFMVDSDPDYVTGHSQGAAKAQLAIPIAKSHGMPSDCQLITFGSPRAANPGLPIHSSNHGIAEATRFASTWDPVTWVPLSRYTWYYTVYAKTKWLLRVIELAGSKKETLQSSSSPADLHEAVQRLFQAPPATASNLGNKESASDPLERLGQEPGMLQALKDIMHLARQQKPSEEEVQTLLKALPDLNAYLSQLGATDDEGTSTWSSIYNILATVVSALLFIGSMGLFDILDLIAESGFSPVTVVLFGIGLLYGLKNWTWLQTWINDLLKKIGLDTILQGILEIIEGLAELLKHTADDIWEWIRKIAKAIYDKIDPKQYLQMLVDLLVEWKPGLKPFAEELISLLSFYETVAWESISLLDYAHVGQKVTFNFIGHGMDNYLKHLPD